MGLMGLMSLSYESHKSHKSHRSHPLAEPTEPPSAQTLDHPPDRKLLQNCNPISVVHAALPRVSSQG